MCGQRDESLLLDDLIDASGRLIELGERVPAGRLGADREVNEMVLWNLVVLGEATKRLKPSTRARFGDVAWKRMAGTRDRIAHAYEGIDWAVVESIISDELPTLLIRLTAIRDTLRIEADPG